METGSEKWHIEQMQTSAWKFRSHVSGSSFLGGMGSFWETLHRALLNLFAREDCLEDDVRGLFSLLVCWREMLYLTLLVI